VNWRAIGVQLSGSGVHESDEKIMAAMHELFADMGATGTDLIEATGLSKTTVYRSRRRLIDAGRLRMEKRSVRLFLGPAEV
jgi:DNA-binding IclR family transcriptional regulator